MRLKELRVYTGDLVSVSKIADTYVVDKIWPRNNVLLRPPIANVDQAIVVTAITQPPLDLLYIDRILLQLELEKICGILCINKQDVEDMSEIERIYEIYSYSKYKCIITSAVTGYGLNDLSHLLSKKITVFAGQSGVGKSKLISALIGVDLIIGELSQSLRGRHTTKWIELLPVSNEGYIADTPGFSKLDLIDIEPHELGYLYPEFRQYVDLCHYPRCLHKTESRCAVLDALRQGKITKERYDNYLVLLDEAIERARRKYE